jgi:hypothetical protein
VAKMCRVTGKVTDSGGNTPTRVVFVPRAVAGVADARREVAVRLTDSVLDVSLAPGEYTMHVGRSRYRVTVPDQPLVGVGALIEGGGHGARNG